jgi:hypothetical protein
MDRRQFLKTLGFGTAGAALATYGVVSSEYMDIFGFDEKVQAGRTKNSIAAVVTGLVGQKLYGNSNIDIDIEKSLWPDAKVTGYTTPESVETHVDLALTSAHFSAQNKNGLLEGEVDKSEFDWKVKQTGSNSYDIARFGPKFDARLELRVQDGKISGTYIRPGPHFDWGINGTYDQNGNVKFEIDGHMNLGITLNGKITPK